MEKQMNQLSSENHELQEEKDFYSSQNEQLKMLLEKNMRQDEEKEEDTELEELLDQQK